MLIPKNTYREFFHLNNSSKYRRYNFQTQPPNDDRCIDYTVDGATVRYITNIP